MQVNTHNKVIKNLVYGVEALWIYNKEQLNYYIISEFLKTIAAYKTPKVSAIIFRLFIF